MIPQRLRLTTMKIRELPEDADEAGSEETAYLLSDPDNAEFLRRGIAEHPEARP